MARINIEITDTAAAGEAGGALRVQTTAAPSTSADVSGVPPDLAAQAAAMGAHNAGAAPSLGGMPSSAAPMPFMASSEPGAAQAESESAGAPPAHLLGSTQA